MNGFRPLHLLLATSLALLLWFSGRTLGPLALLLSVWLLSRPLSREEEGRTVRSLLLVLVALWILYQARWVVYPLACGTLLAYVLAPPVAWLEARRVRRPLAAFLALLPIGIFGGLALFLLLPALARQTQLLVSRLPEAYDLLQRWAQPLLRRLGEMPAPAVPPGAEGTPPGVLPAGPEAAVQNLPPWLAQVVQHAESYLGTAARGLIGMGKGLGKILQWVAVLTLTPVVGYYLCLDWKKAGAWVLDWLPSSWHRPAGRISRAAQDSLRIYVRGQVLVALIEMVLYSLIFFLAGLSTPIALGILCGMLSLIPILGFWTTVLLVVLTSVTGPAPGSHLLKAGIGLAALSVFEGQILVPRIQGKGLGLHPLAVLLGVLFFGTLFGVPGVLLAVPAMGVLQTFLAERKRGRTEDHSSAEAAGRRWSPSGVEAPFFKNGATTVSNPSNENPPYSK